MSSLVYIYTTVSEAACAKKQTTDRHVNAAENSTHATLVHVCNKAYGAAPWGTLHTLSGPAKYAFLRKY